MADPSLNTVSQFAHFFTAYAITMSFLVVMGFPVLWWFVPVAVGLAAWKEFWYDYKYETAEVRGSSLEDFSFYLSGITAGILFFTLFGV